MRTHSFFALLSMEGETCHSAGVIEFVFPGRLQHRAPLWVPSGAVFHIRIKARSSTLLEPEVATALLESAQFYHERERWFIWLFLLMPDHVHALLTFQREERMSSVVGDWKRYQTRKLNLTWQEGYFDHRLRREESYSEKAAYIRNNPVAKGLCESGDDWKWLIASDTFPASSR